MYIIRQQCRCQRIALAPLIGSSIKGKADRGAAVYRGRYLLVSVYIHFVFLCHHLADLFVLDGLRVFCTTGLAALSAGLLRRQFAA